ncbi:hypothetical protein [Akkermansia sp.]|uniref:hypothetical protein n=1 Tax=Akkermansia sp. TaxID=1872421 RepID=UPI0025BFD9FA|nr:hypothetical protein [Akkermansia sp.]MCC8148437.1 hypothetical protein [Akkermansia sp.]
MILLSQMELLSEARYLKMVQVSIWGRKLVQLTLTLFNTQRECGTGGTWTLSVFFTVPENVIIDSIALNLFTFNGSNQAPRDPLYGAYDFKLKLGEDVFASCSDSFLTYGGVVAPVIIPPVWMSWGSRMVLPERGWNQPLWIKR